MLNSLKVPLLRCACAAILASGLIASSSADPLPPRYVFDWPSTWQTNVCSGEPLAKENYLGDKLPRVHDVSPLFQRGKTTPGLSGIWESRNPIVMQELDSPRTERFVESDLLGKVLLVKHEDGGGNKMRHHPDGRLYLTIFDARGVPGGAILYWKIHYGFLYHSINEDISEPIRFRLIKRSQQQLVVELNGQEMVWEYLPPESQRETK